METRRDREESSVTPKEGVAEHDTRLRGSMWFVYLHVVMFGVVDNRQSGHRARPPAIRPVFYSFGDGGIRRGHLPFDLYTY
jgi:hypothetical protein